MNLVIKVWFALEAGKQLSEDRKQGALELLLSTPLTVQDILRGQRLALERQFLGPVMVVLMVLFLVKGSAIAWFADLLLGVDDRSQMGLGIDHAAQAAGGIPRCNVPSAFAKPTARQA